MRRSGCMKFALGALIVLILCCLFAWFGGKPWVESEIRDGVGNAISTEIASTVPDISSDGEIRFSLKRLQVAIENENENNSGTSSIKGFTLTAEGDTIVARAQATGEDLEYRFVPRVTEDGKLAFDSSATTDTVFTKIIGPDLIGDSISKGVNQYLDSKGLRLTGVSLDGDDLVLEVSKK